MRPDPSTPKRSLVKAVSWETFSNLVCFGLAYSMFGNLGGCITFTLICFVVKLILYYYHERAWHQVSWGKSMEQLCWEAYKRGEAQPLSEVIEELKNK